MDDGEEQVRHFVSTQWAERRIGGYERHIRWWMGNSWFRGAILHSNLVAVEADRWISTKLSKHRSTCFSNRTKGSRSTFTQHWKSRFANDFYVSGDTCSIFNHQPGSPTLFQWLDFLKTTLIEPESEEEHLEASLEEDVQDLGEFVEEEADETELLARVDARIFTPQASTTQVELLYI